MVGMLTISYTVDGVLTKQQLRYFRPLEITVPCRLESKRGIAKQAVMSPLSDLMKRYGTFFRVEELTHGNKKKTDRVMWALQGRFENGYITLNKGVEQ